MGFVKDRTVRRVAGLGLLVALAGLAPLASQGQGGGHGPKGGIQITLRRDFITTYKDRATIDTMFTVDKAHPRPNPPAKDGDMHIAGRAPEDIGLATVAEIMNAKFQPMAMKRIHAVEGTGKPVRISGAWRIWCEHGGTKKQLQGAPLKPFTTTNPDHVFEIHPITQIDGMSLLDSFKPIKGFATKDAHDAFVNYENLTCKISEGNGTVTLTTHMGGYNYVEFVLELNEDPQPMKDKDGNVDGTYVLAQVRDLEGELLVRNRNMVFVKDTAPEEQVKQKKRGGRMHVLGIPRISLKLVDWRIAHKDDPEQPLTWTTLPYEIIVVAVYPGAPEGDD
jgi:hypothetical protein